MQNKDKMKIITKTRKRTREKYPEKRRRKESEVSDKLTKEGEAEEGNWKCRVAKPSCRGSCIYYKNLKN